jgi:enterochelin esterase-like enzyme
MSLTGTPVLILTGLLAVLAPILAFLLWDKVAGTPVLRTAQRLGLLILCQFTAVLVTAIAVNDQFALYESWADVFGVHEAVVAGPASEGPGPAGGPVAGGQPGSRFQPLPAGRVVSETITGPASGIRAKIWIVLPADYAATAANGRRYPVIEFLPGYPGSPTTWLHTMALQKTMDAEVSAGRVKPFIAVLPTMNVASPRDTECTDIPHGPKVATWLGTDVPRIVQEQTRALPLGRGYGITGYSTGGFCTAKLLLTRPDAFHAGAVLAGYYTASSDLTTGNLFGNNQNVRQVNDPTWLVTHRPTPDSHILLMYSLQDPETSGPTQRFLSAVRPPLRADELRLTRGGHNTNVWFAIEPQVLAWLTKNIG